MFQKAELERLQKQKELLVLQSDANRLLLAVDWQRIRSPDNWMSEAGSLARRHPVWTAVLAATAGTLVVKAVRNPGALLGGIGGLGKLASLALTGWKLFKEKNPGH